MSNSKSDTEVISQDWVQKIHFDNKVDLNLQIPVKDESIKIEIDDIPADYLSKLEESTTINNKNSDSYLQSILSSPSPNKSSGCTGNQSCTCYKCQRQRRRAGVNRGGGGGVAGAGINKSDRTTEGVDSPTLLSSSTTSPTSSVAFVNSPTSTTMISPLLTPAQSPQPQKAIPVKTPKRSNTLRKTPTLKSYEKHIPKPTYSQKDSIYRIEQEEDNEKREINEEEKKNYEKLINDNNAQQDSYQMAWKEDGTGDDLLSSLVTFQTIFEEKGTENEGLSDLLEQRAQELKYQKLREQAEALNPKKDEPQLPPRRSDCLTLSYRNGAKHNPLTLYHTMKMPGEQERMSAYNVAYKHCINANSGLKSWMKRSRSPPTRENSKLIQPIRRPTVKRSLLHPLASRKNKVAGDELLVWSASSENLNNNRKKSIDMISSPIPITQHTPSPGLGENNGTTASQLTDVLSVAQALLPNQNLTTNQQQQSKSNKTPYEHIDTPSRPRTTANTTTSYSSSPSTPDLKDNSSISSAESTSGTTTASHGSSNKLMKSRPGRLFSSLGRKTSMRSHSSSSNKSSSIKSLEKIETISETPSFEKVLDDLCRILPHIERSQLAPYVHESNNDYIVALQLCKAAVISGKLS